MSQDNNNQSFKDSLKATSLFGGVQAYNILINVIRSKFIAILLGPTGMGISGLYFSATSFINSISSLGLSSSAVRNISMANETGDKQRISLVISVFRRLVWITGLIGLIACLFLSPVLSKITFGDSDHTIGFVFLSCTLLFQQLTNGQNALLQGIHRYKYLAKANVLGSTIGLFVTVPLYYIWGIDAIVPVLILTSVTSMLLAYYYSKKVQIEPVKVSRTQVKVEGRSMVVMGFMISLSSMLSLAASYLIRIFISNTGSISDVGLYNAGFSIINTYVGLIFTAMGTDFYPRLSAVSNDTERFNSVINNQIEISLLILGPIVAAFIIFIRLIVIILFSHQFLPIEGMIYWAMFAIYFKTLSNLIAFSFLAKADSKFYFWNELSAIIYTMLLNMVCYHYWGLTGMGISFLISYVLYLMQVWIICSKRFCMKISHSVYNIFAKQLLISILCIIIVIIGNSLIKYSVGSLLIIISALLAYKDLNKRINVKNIIFSKLHR